MQIYPFGSRSNWPGNHDVFRSHGEGLMPVRFSDAEENRPFREACETVERSAAGKDATEIRQMLTDEFRSRDIPVPPPLIGLIAASIASGSNDADDGPSFPGEPSWPGRAAGWVFRRLRAARALGAD